MDRDYFIESVRILDLKNSERVRQNDCGNVSLIPRSSYLGRASDGTPLIRQTVSFEYIPRKN